MLYAMIPLTETSFGAASLLTSLACRHTRLASHYRRSLQNVAVISGSARTRQPQNFVSSAPHMVSSTVSPYSTLSLPLAYCAPSTKSQTSSSCGSFVSYSSCESPQRGSVSWRSAALCRETFETRIKSCRMFSNYHNPMMQQQCSTGRPLPQVGCVWLIQTSVT